MVETEVTLAGHKPRSQEERLVMEAQGQCPGRSSDGGQLVLARVGVLSSSSGLGPTAKDHGDGEGQVQAKPLQIEDRVRASGTVPSRVNMPLSPLELRGRAIGAQSHMRLCQVVRLFQVAKPCREQPVDCRIWAALGPGRGPRSPLSTFLGQENRRLAGLVLVLARA